VLDETSTLPVQTAYGHFKQEAERLVRESGLPSVMIRPSHVYGPGGWYAEEIVKRLKRPGRFVVTGSGQNWWDVVRVEDVATACVEAAERAPACALYERIKRDLAVHAWRRPDSCSSARGEAAPSCAGCPCSRNRQFGGATAAGTRWGRRIHVSHDRSFVAKLGPARSIDPGRAGRSPAV
jgi:NAD dependent epimerase/dehydratase family